MKESRLHHFLTLAWYDLLVSALFAFAAKTSEVLLSAGLVVSTTNFLTDGSILNTYPALSTIWSWTQAIAIDTSLGVCLAYTLTFFKQKAWLKGMLYGVLTLLLALVAGVVTNIDIVSHALHLSMSVATTRVGIDVIVLSRLRAIAVVGFLLMSRLRDIPVLNPLTKTETVPPRHQGNGALARDQRVQQVIQSLCSQFSAWEVAHILNACLAAHKVQLAPMPLKEQGEPERTSVEQDQRPTKMEELELRTAPAPREPAPWVTSSDLIQQDQHAKAEPEALQQMALLQKAVPAGDPQVQPLLVPEPEVVLSDPVPEPSEPGTEPAQETTLERENRLEQAYHALWAEGKKPSGRALAERAHVHRSTCVEWLRARVHHANADRQGSHEPKQDEGASSDAHAQEPSEEGEGSTAAAPGVSPGRVPKHQVPQDTPGPP